MKKLSLLFIVLIVGAIGWWYVATHPTTPVVVVPPVSTTTAPAVTTTPPIVTSTPQEAKITLDTLKPGDKVTSPLTITGKARGNWYFEASFPVELLDSSGTQLVQAPAQATSDWMTTDWVPFTLTLNFPTSTTATGTLKFKNDNPSGDPAKDQFYMVEVKF